MSARNSMFAFSSTDYGDWKNSKRKKKKIGEKMQVK